MKPDRHYEHKQHAFDSYCKKVLKYEAYNGYAYKYTDACGKTQFVYAWKLVPPTRPHGQADDISLREKVKEILRDLNDGSTPSARR